MENCKKCDFEFERMCFGIRICTGSLRRTSDLNFTKILMVSYLLLWNYTLEYRNSQNPDIFFPSKFFYHFCVSIKNKLVIQRRTPVWDVMCVVFPFSYPLYLSLTSFTLITLYTVYIHIPIHINCTFSLSLSLCKNTYMIHINIYYIL